MLNKTIALILAAGKGTRLLSLTREIPKPLIKVNNLPIILRLLNALEKTGIKKCLIVVGYKAKVLRRQIDRKYKNRLRVEYITNKEFASTNNMYSLWLARDYLLGYDCLLLEADVVFDWRLLRLLNWDSPHSFWLADKFRKDMNGALLVTDKKRRIRQIRIVKSKPRAHKDNYFKSIGILSLKNALTRKLFKWLDKEQKAGNKNIYYDLVLAKHLKEADLFVKYIDKFKWWEIDNEKDLEYARKLFK